MRGAKPTLGNVIPMKGDYTQPVPDPPLHLATEDREVWERLAPVLVAKGRLEKEYEDSFAAFCVVAGQVVRSASDIAIMGTYYEVKTRNGMQQKHRVAWVQLQQAIAVMNQLSARFGLTPVDDARLKGGAQGDLFKDLMGALDGTD